MPNQGEEDNCSASRLIILLVRMLAYGQNDPGIKSNLTGITTLQLVEQGSSAFNQKYPTSALASDCNKSGATFQQWRVLLFVNWYIVQRKNMLDVADSANITCCGSADDGTFRQ